MSAASRPASTGKTRTCPHCKATILESLSICPGCMHHLRFDSEAAKRQVAAAPALRVEGMIRHPPLEQPLEYFVIIAIRNDRGEEVTRQVVNVGALQAAEKRTFTLSVEVLPPQAPVAAKSTSTTGTFKSPVAQPTATVRPSTPASGTTASSGASGATSSSTTSSSTAVSPPKAAGVTGSPAGSPGQAKPGVGGVGQRGASGPGVTRTQSQPRAPGSGGTGTQGQPGAPGSGGTGTQGQPGASGSGVTGTQGQPGAAGQSPANNPGQPKPADPGSSTNPSKPTSGYILKPPSPGGPKRH
jgi:hypothetical protein